MRKKKRYQYKRMISKLIVLCFLTVLITVCYKIFIPMNPHRDYAAEGNLYGEATSGNEDQRNGVDTNAAYSLSADTLVSQNAILICLDDHEILLDKNSSDKIYPASLTKIMTALVAIENLHDLNQLIPLPSELFTPLYKEDASLAGFLPGEDVPAIDLIFGVLLPSGAECCVGLSDFIAGSEEAFVALMNEKAETLGMEDTHFTNSTGLHDSNHYSSVSDLAVLLEYSLHNDTFREIFTSQRHSTGATKLHPDGFTFYSTMFKNMTTYELTDGSVLGGKTGYTSEAGLCLASLAEKNGKEYIMVSVNAKGNHKTEQYNITDALYVYSKLE